MARRIKSPTRTISNRGGRPRFIGHFPSHKGKSDRLPFDSISSLYCAIWLESRPEVLSIEFEPERHKFEAGNGTPAVEAIPDYRCVLNTGEIEFTDAKYDKVGLSLEESEKLDHVGEHLRARGYTHQVVYRKALEKSGFVQTILLLRPYGQLPYSKQSLASAKQRLGRHQPCPLTTWREHAKIAGVPVGMLYHLLYHRQLELVYRPLAVIELSKCLG